VDQQINVNPRANLVPQIMSPLGPEHLAEGIRSSFVEGVNGLTMHVLEAGFDPPDRPLLLLLHGFPELAYSWRSVLLPLAAAGFHVVAPDQRGYGRTTGWLPDYDQDLRPFSMLRLATDALALVHAVGRHRVAAVIGHDFGAPVAAWCALTRPDVFNRVVLMSAPFSGPPRGLPGASPHIAQQSREQLTAALAGLPSPRKHYQHYFSTREANAEMLQAQQGLHNFLRAYFHSKSADWAGNQPVRLSDGSAAQLARMPAYYIMDKAKTMPESVAQTAPDPALSAKCKWLSDQELAVYAAEFQRTGFQGGLNWYRARFEAEITADERLYADRTIDVPALFIAGHKDWGVYQVPGAFERMQSTACRYFSGSDLMNGAGHWVMQEQPTQVAAAILAFLQRG
jgi:pimeloyl-ACP methyl ester carboxylesterase